MCDTIPETRQPLLVAQKLTKSFAVGSRTHVNAVAAVDLSVHQGQIAVIRGASGSGKTTLLLMLAGMLAPSAGNVQWLGQDIYAQNVNARRRLRTADIGIVLPHFHLIPYIDVESNIALALSSGQSPKNSLSILKQFGIESLASRFPSQLSSGEKRRVIVARTMIRQPRLILADEPTANLDPENADLVNAQFAAYAQSGGSLLYVTHARTITLQPDVEYQMSQGHLQPVEVRNVNSSQNACQAE